MITIVEPFVIASFQMSNQIVTRQTTVVETDAVISGRQMKGDVISGRQLKGSPKICSFRNNSDVDKIVLFESDQDGLLLHKFNLKQLNVRGF